MKVEHFLEAMGLIVKSHSVDLVVNHVPRNGQVTPVLESPTIGIRNCPAAVVNNLKEAGFTVSMKDGLLVVDRY